MKTRPRPLPATRRAMAKGLVWTVPAVVATSSAPAFAASTGSGGLIIDVIVHCTTRVTDVSIWSSESMIPAGTIVTLTMYFPLGGGRSTVFPGILFLVQSPSFPRSPAAGETITVTMVTLSEIAPGGVGTFSITYAGPFQSQLSVASEPVRCISRLCGTQCPPV